MLVPCAVERFLPKTRLRLPGAARLPSGPSQVALVWLMATGVLAPLAFSTHSRYIPAGTSAGMLTVSSESVAFQMRACFSAPPLPLAAQIHTTVSLPASDPVRAVNRVPVSVRASSGSAVSFQAAIAGAAAPAVAAVNCGANASPGAVGCNRSHNIRAGSRKRCRGHGGPGPFLPASL